MHFCLFDISCQKLWHKLGNMEPPPSPYFTLDSVLKNAESDKHPLLIKTFWLHIILWKVQLSQLCELVLEIAYLDRHIKKSEIMQLFNRRVSSSLWLYIESMTTMNLLAFLLFYSFSLFLKATDWKICRLNDSHLG